MRKVPMENQDVETFHGMLMIFHLVAAEKIVACIWEHTLHRTL